MFETTNQVIIILWHVLDISGCLASETCDQHSPGLTQHCCLTLIEHMEDDHCLQSDIKMGQYYIWLYYNHWYSIYILYIYDISISYIYISMTVCVWTKWIQQLNQSHRDSNLNFFYSPTLGLHDLHHCITVSLYHFHTPYVDICIDICSIHICMSSHVIMPSQHLTTSHNPITSTFSGPPGNLSKGNGAASDAIEKFAPDVLWAATVLHA